MIKELGLMMVENNREISKLQTVTDALIKETDEIEKRIMFTNQYISRIV